MGKVLFSISGELLVDAMHMPEDTKIQSVGLKKQLGHVLIEILAIHNDIPEGFHIHETGPIVTAVEYCKRCYRPTQLSWDWNIKEVNNDI